MKEKKAAGLVDAAIDFFMAIWNCPVKYIAIENPVGVINKGLPPTQIIQPWHFGDAATKRTCLWLKGFPKLTATVALSRKGKTIKYGDGKAMSEFLHGAKTVNGSRSCNRSKTFPGIAAAMADQWGEFLKKEVGK